MLTRILRAYGRLAMTLTAVTLSFALPHGAQARTAVFASTSGAQALHTIAPVADMPREAPLEFTDAAPVSIQNDPEQVYQATVRTPARAYSADDLSCMAEALYHEARGEGRRGQQAVAEVILNRVESRRFPRTVCGVVNQRSQFSYTIGGKPRIRNQAAYARATQIAREALSGAPRDLTGGATYFHTTRVRPNWSNRFHRTTRIGNHIFYRPSQRLASN